MQNLSRDNVRSIVKQCIRCEIKEFDCAAFFKRLSFAETLEVRQLIEMETDEDDGIQDRWESSCDLVSRTVFVDADGSQPLWDSGQEIADGQPPVFVRALVHALLAANGGGEESEDAVEAVKND